MEIEDLRARLDVLERAFGVLLSRTPPMGEIVEAGLRIVAESGFAEPQTDLQRRRDEAAIRLADLIAREIGEVRRLSGTPGPRRG